MIDAIVIALAEIAQPARLGFLALGVLAGLAIGMIPGISGLAGLAILLPFTFGMDPYSAFAVLLGLGAVTSTSDTIPAVLFGVPGTAGAQATVVDGHPMARRGEAGRALSAAFAASMLGGLFGALVLFLAVPVLRPVILFVGTPELLAIAVLGLATVSTLAGSAPLRGIAGACAGLALAFVGGAPQDSTLRWTFDTLYLYDGLPLLPVAIGLFALPELCDVAVRRRTRDGPVETLSTGVATGVRDALANGWLIVRCSSIGAAVGALPGLGASVVDWIAYGHAARSVRGASETFGKGDVRGVIAPESASNAKEGGALIPTLAFGVPGSASMAILLGAFLVHGLVPGPSMLDENLPLTYAMVFSIALANLLGAGLCLGFAGMLGRIASVRHTLIMPAVYCTLTLGAFLASRDWADLYALFAFGLLGWTMKRLGWPRPPVILGFVLGPFIERYLTISTARWGFDWLARPMTAAILLLALVILVRPLIAGFSEHLGRNRRRWTAKPRLEAGHAFALVVSLVGVWGIAVASGWSAEARAAPVGVLAVMVAAVTASLANTAFRTGAPQGRIAGDLPGERLRATAFFAWLAGFLAAMATLGFIPATGVFVLAYLRVQGREGWTLSLGYAVAMTAFATLVFDRLLAVPWPESLLGRLIPAATLVPSV